MDINSIIVAVLVLIFLIIVIRFFNKKTEIKTIFEENEELMEKEIKAIHEKNQKLREKSIETNQELIQEIRLLREQLERFQK